MFSIWLSKKFIARKRIIKTARFYASTTVPTNYLPTSTHQIGMHTNVTVKTICITVHRIYVYMSNMNVCLHANKNDDYRNYDISKRFYYLILAFIIILGYLYNHSFTVPF